MKHALTILVLLFLLAPLSARAAPVTGSWQIYTVAHGLPDYWVSRVAVDGSGGMWTGHFAGGRGIPHFGGLAYISPQGEGRTYHGEPLQACPTVSGLAAAPDGTIWLHLTGYHDYGSTDYRNTCVPRYGQAVGFIDENDTIQMLPPEVLPEEVLGGPITDYISRPWVATRFGVAVREHDGTWREVQVWAPSDEYTSAIESYAFGSAIVVGSNQGRVATITINDDLPEQVTFLPSIPITGTTPVRDLAVGPTGVAVVIDNRLYLQNIPRGIWDPVLPPPTDTAIYLATYVGGTLYAGSSPSGLLRLDADGWTRLPAGETPLPGNIIFGTAVQGSSLYLGTNFGLAHLNTSGQMRDPQRARQAFDALWERTEPVTASTWVWGPPGWDERYEPFRQAPGGYRLVRYYDKARMELTRPEENIMSPWYITNGLVVSEMIRGRVQLGADPEAAGCPTYYYRTCPAYVPVAGNLTNDNPAPRYTDFSQLTVAVGPIIGQRIDNVLGEAIAPIANDPAQRAGLATDATTIVVYDEVTGHNIPRVFWDYMQEQPLDWLYLFGRPIVEPYWVVAQVGDQQRLVLVQLFERRTLTYTPDNPPQWQVEMGNVGQHYYRWRYGPAEPPPWSR